MGISKFRITDKDLKKGVWINEIDFINLIKICKIRNQKLYKKLVDAYEFCEDKKFDTEIIKK